jgi:glycosyltransferase involved in cell wall biosynthesis
VGAREGVHYVAAESPDALAEATARLLAAPEERVRIATAARSLVETEYSWDSRARALLDLYGDRTGAA